MKRPRTAGFAAIALVILLALSLAAALALQHWQQSAQHRHRNQKNLYYSTAWAEAAVETYAAWHGHLPCPSLEPHGDEARRPDGRCSQAAGWLPVNSLLGPVADGSWRPPATAYEVAANANTLADRGAALSVDESQQARVNAYDLCEKIESGHWSYSASQESSDAAYRIDIKGVSGQPGMHSTIAKTALHRRLGCGTAMASVWGIQQALPFSTLVAGDKKGTQDGFWLFSPLLFLDNIATVSASASTVGNILNEVDVIVQSVLAEVACLGLCPNFYAAIATEGTASTLTAADVAQTAVDLGTSFGYTAAYSADFGLVMATPDWASMTAPGSAIKRPQTLARVADQLGGDL